jgi:hypothetical protein
MCFSASLSVSKAFYGDSISPPKSNSFIAVSFEQPVCILSFVKQGEGSQKCCTMPLNKFASDNECSIGILHFSHYTKSSLL